MADSQHNPERAVFDKVRDFIDRHSMIEGSAGVVVAVSGGPDSVSLLDILARLGCGGEVGVHVAHLNHRLRGSESDRDAEFVSTLTARLGLPCTVKSLDVREQAAEAARGIEVVAREIRYRFLLETSRTLGFDRIATGHTMNDQAETLLMRLIRGSGTRGLAAMRPVVIAHIFERFESGEPLPLIVRPLLCVTRNEVETYCRQRGLEWRTDPTNLETTYTRNRVRHEVLPALAALNPKAVEAIARAAELAAADEEVLASIASRLLDAAVQPGAISSRERATYSASAFSAQPPALRRRMILTAIERFRRGRLLWEVTSAHIEAVESLLEEGSSGRTVDLAGGTRAGREYDAIVFTSPRPSWETYDLDFEAAGVTVVGLRLTLERGIPAREYGRLIDDALQRARSSGRDWMEAVVDDTALPERLRVRTRRAGERAHAAGQKREKKLKNLMIDSRIPAGLRGRWPVVTTGDDRYVWSPGLPHGVEFTASAKSEALAVLRAEEA